MDNSLDLETRTGLPPALKVLVQEFPRTIWDTHPNFDGMTRFWLERHLGFRRLLEMLQTDVQAQLDGAMSAEVYAPRLSRLAGMLLNQLHGHHQIEDTHYFPRLAQLDARAERGFDLLEADHDAMDGLLHGMAEGANAVLRGGEAGPFHDRLLRFGTLLDRHLTDEEEIVVPVILKSGFQG